MLVSPLTLALAVVSVIALVFIAHYALSPPMEAVRLELQAHVENVARIGRPVRLTIFPTDLSGQPAEVDSIDWRVEGIRISGASAGAIRRSGSRHTAYFVPDALGTCRIAVGARTARGEWLHEEVEIVVADLSRRAHPVPA